MSESDGLREAVKILTGMADGELTKLGGFAEDAPHLFIEDTESKPAGWCKCGRSKEAALHVVTGTNVCTVCDTRDWPTDERGPVVDDCNICEGPSCAWHGKDYKDGFQHEVCHEAHDHTRAEEGTY